MSSQYARFILKGRVGIAHLLTEGWAVPTLHPYNPPRMGLSGRVLILALSAALLGVALHVNGGLYSPVAIALMGSSLLLCVAGVLTPMPDWLNPPEGRARIVMSLLAGAMMIAMYFKTAGASEATVPAVDQFPYRVGITTALAAVVLIAVGRWRLGAIGFAMLLGAHL